jgi:hypothetical protein
MKIGNEVYHFALRTVSTIIKAITWVFKKLGVLIKDIVDFFGYLFQWNDILETAEGIFAGFNAALAYGELLLDQSEFDVDSWLENLRATIKAKLPGLQNNSYDGSDQAFAELNEGNSAITRIGCSIQDDVKSGVAYNWSTYYFTYGGGTTNALLHDDNEAHKSSEETILKLWDDVQNEVETIVKDGGMLVKDLFQFFISGSLDIQGLMGRITADLVDMMIDSLKNLADILPNSRDA